MRLSGRLGLLLALSLSAASSVTVLREAEAQPAALDVTGVWTTTFSGISQPLRLVQSGVNVAGVYGGGGILPGGMGGRFQGLVMVGRWTDAASSGGLRLVFAPNGRSFVGTWGRTLDSQTSGGAWVGTR
jgi:hypothetical protein